MIKFYSVFVGHYEVPNISKKDVKKLNDLGMRGYLFSMGDFFSVKVSAFPNELDAQRMVATLKQHGFDAYYKL